MLLFQPPGLAETFLPLDDWRGSGRSPGAIRPSTTASPSCRHPAP
jgi:hypothetical protein